MVMIITCCDATDTLTSAVAELQLQQLGVAEAGRHLLQPI